MARNRKNTLWSGSINKRVFRKGNIPDVEILDTRVGLFVEAKKSI